MTGPLQKRLAQGFAAAFGGAPNLVARAPGRVNLIGEHTDYNDGFALPVAIGRETCVALRRRPGTTISVAAVDYGEQDCFDVAQDFARGSEIGWRDYVLGTVAVLARAGVPIQGAELAIAGDIPKGTGLSSSASLEVAVTTALLAAAGQTADPKQVALWAQSAENDFVGMRCGNLDQIAAAASIAGSALLIDCRSLESRPVPLPDGTAIMIVQSGVVRGLVEGAYNMRRRECETAAAALGVAALCDADLAMLERAGPALDPIVFRRARHVITENARTLAAAEALAAGDLPAMGQLMAESHASQRDDFRITVAATDRLAGLLGEAIGDRGGARQTGGGFGGAVVALMPQSCVAHVREHVLDHYRTPGGAVPDVQIEYAAGGASLVSGASS